MGLFDKILKGFNSFGGLTGIPGMSLPIGGSSGGMGIPGLGSLFGGEGDSSLTAGLGGGGVLGGLTGSEAIYGRKPNPVPISSPAEILQQNSLANLGSAENVRKLAHDENTFNLDENLSMLEKAAPGTAGAQKQNLANILASLQGKLSQSTTDAISRYTAARGVDRGTSGSGFDENDAARHIGVASEAEQQRGATNLANVLESTRKYAIPKPFDTSASFLKPTYDPYAEFQNNLYNEKILAGPVPAAAGAAAAQQALVESVLAAYSGTPHSGSSTPPPAPGSSGVATNPYNPAARSTTEFAPNYNDFGGAYSDYA